MASSSPDPASKRMRHNDGVVENLLELINQIQNNGMGDKEMVILEDKLTRSRGDFNREKVLLYYASKIGPALSLEVVKLFIEHGSNINDQDERGRTILHWVAEKKVSGADGYDGEEDVLSKLELINHLVEEGVDVSLTDKHGNDPFKLLLRCGQPADIIARFMDIIGTMSQGMVSMSSSQLMNQRNKAGHTCLYYILNGQLFYKTELIRTLINLGADPNVAVDSKGTSAFEFAIDRRHILNIPLLTMLIPSNGELVKEINGRSHRSGIKIMGRLIENGWTQIDKQEFEDFLNKLIAAGFDIAEDGFLSRAISIDTFRSELIEVLVRKKVPIAAIDIMSAIQLQRFDVAILLLNAIYETDQDQERDQKTGHGKVVEIYPDFICDSLLFVDYHPFRSFDRTMVDVIKVLLEKFKLDINFCDQENFILHNLIGLPSKNKDAVLDYILTHPYLDIDKKVNSVSALNFALDTGSFDIAAKLIRNFASIADLEITPPTAVGFIDCYQLLYQLGVEIKFNEENPDDVQGEVDTFNDWIDRQKNDVKSLIKLCTLVIRRNVSSRTCIKDFTDSYELLPKTVQMLNLTDEQVVYGDNLLLLSQLFDSDI